MHEVLTAPVVLCSLPMEGHLRKATPCCLIGQAVASKVFSPSGISNSCDLQQESCNLVFYENLAIKHSVT